MAHPRNIPQQAAQLIDPIPAPPPLIRQYGYMKINGAFFGGRPVDENAQVQAEVTDHKNEAKHMDAKGPALDKIEAVIKSKSFK